MSLFLFRRSPGTGLWLMRTWAGSYVPRSFWRLATLGWLRYLGARARCLIGLHDPYSDPWPGSRRRCRSCNRPMP